MKVTLGIDYGEKRVGLAISDETGRLAVPSETLTPATREELLDDLARIVREKNIEQIVVGLPLALSGGQTEQTTKTQDFICMIEEQLNIPVDIQDERFTTVEAARGGTDKSTKDARAAALILQTYLDRMAQEAP